MLNVLRSLIGAARSFFKTQKSLALENLALRHQIGVLKRTAGKRRLHIGPADRGFWAALSRVFKGWEQVSPGKMSAVQYDQAVGDLVNYLQWMGEPAQNTRTRIGVGVLIFLAFFIFIAWRLNAAFWKDVK